MQNTLTDLNNALFAEIENLQDETNQMSGEKLDATIKRSTAVAKVAEVIVRNAELSLKVMEHMNEYAYCDNGAREVLAPVPAMLEAK